MKQAKCTKLDVNLFFNLYETSTDTAKATDRLCARCPVANECLQFAIETKSTGCWSGIYLSDGDYCRSHNKHKTKLQIKNAQRRVQDMINQLGLSHG